MRKETGIRSIERKLRANFEMAEFDNDFCSNSIIFATSKCALRGRIFSHSGNELVLSWVRGLRDDQ